MMALQLSYVSTGKTPTLIWRRPLVNSVHTRLKLRNFPLGSRVCANALSRAPFTVLFGCSLARDRLCLIALINALRVLFGLSMAPPTWVLVCQADHTMPATITKSSAQLQTVVLVQPGPRSRYRAIFAMSTLAWPTSW